jgi:hypothetical protein
MCWRTCWAVDQPPTPFLVGWDAAARMHTTDTTAHDRESHRVRRSGLSKSIAAEAAPAEQRKYAAGGATSVAMPFRGPSDNDRAPSNPVGLAVARLAIHRRVRAAASHPTPIATHAPNGSLGPLASARRSAPLLGSPSAAVNDGRISPKGRVHGCTRVRRRRRKRRRRTPTVVHAPAGQDARRALLSGCPSLWSLSLGQALRRRSGANSGAGPKGGGQDARSHGK